MSHGLVSHMSESCYANYLADRPSHVTQLDESWHTYESVMSHIWMSHVTHMNESCHTYEWVMSHKWMSQVTHMNESYLQPIACEVSFLLSQIATSRIDRVMSHIWMSHVTNMFESCHTCGWVMSHIWMSHLQPIAYGVSFLRSPISIEDLVLWVSFATFRWKETNKIEIRDWDHVVL